MLLAFSWNVVIITEKQLLKINKKAYKTTSHWDLIYRLLVKHETKDMFTLSW